MDWADILAAVVVSVAGGGGLGRWLFKRWSEHVLDQRLKKYEAELELSNARVIEPLKADLRAAAAQREQQYRIMQEKRAEVVARGYTLLVRARRNIGAYIHSLPVKPGPTKEELALPAFEAVNGFLKYFDEHRVYFTETQCAIVDAFTKELEDTQITFGTCFFARDRMPSLSEQEQQNMFARLPMIADKFTNKVPQLEAAIREQFRRMLGVREEDETLVETQPDSSDR